MKRISIYISFILFFCFVFTYGKAQDLLSTKTIKKHKFTLYAGLGPDFYFNNLTVSKDYVREFNYAFVTKFMWEPEHFLSLGFETGYNRLYSIKENPTANSQIKIYNAAIPIQLVISMKFLKDFYGSFTMGQSILLNKVSTLNNGISNNVNATNVSLGDFGLNVGYRKAINSRVFLGSELRGFYSSKLDDKNIGLIFMTGYRL
jgi:hypothetical protein